MLFAVFRKIAYIKSKIIIYCFMKFQVSNENRSVAGIYYLQFLYSRSLLGLKICSFDSIKHYHTHSVYE